MLGTAKPGNKMAKKKKNKLPPPTPPKIDISELLKQTRIDLHNINMIIRETRDLDDTQTLVHYKNHLIKQLTQTIKQQPQLPQLAPTPPPKIPIVQESQQIPAEEVNDETSLPARDVSDMTSNELAIAKPDNVGFKDTRHHYAGFYALNVVPPIDGDYVYIQDTRHYLLPYTVVNFGYSGRDTIISVQRAIESETHIPTGTPVYNSKGAVVSLITGNQDNIYPIQDGFNHENYHLSNIRVTVQNKTKIIAFADKQFDKKEQLVKYLKTQPPKTADEAILYDNNGKSTQLVVYRNGKNILNVHIRSRLINRYHLITNKLTKDLDKTAVTGDYQSIRVTTKTQCEILYDMINKRTERMTLLQHQKEFDIDDKHHTDYTRSYSLI